MLVAVIMCRIDGKSARQRDGGICHISLAPCMGSQEPCIKSVVSRYSPHVHMLLKPSTNAVSSSLDHVGRV